VDVFVLVVPVPVHDGIHHAFAKGYTDPVPLVFAETRVGVGLENLRLRYIDALECASAMRNLNTNGSAKKCGFACPDFGSQEFYRVDSTTSISSS